LSSGILLEFPEFPVNTFVPERRVRKPRLQSGEGAGPGPDPVENG
jgi:hypothetical protein